jgi:hypothetical protein
LIVFRKQYIQSEPYEEELSCSGIFRNESKLVVGSSKGNYYTFNWGQCEYVLYFLKIHEILFFEILEKYCQDSLKI